VLFVTKGGTRRQVTQAVRPMIKAVEMTGGIPSGYWEDPIILGFLSGCIRGLTQLVSNGKYSGGDAGLIAVGVYTDLLGDSDGMAVAGRQAALFHDKVFAEALSSGFLSVIVARHGPAKVMDQAIVAEAISHSKKMKPALEKLSGPTSEATLVSHSIRELTYNRRVEALRSQKAA